MAREGTWLCPTLGVLPHPEGALAHLPPGGAREEGERRVGQVCEVIRRALRIGVRLLTGTDALHGCRRYAVRGNAITDVGCLANVLLVVQSEGIVTLDLNGGVG